MKRLLQTTLAGLLFFCLAVQPLWAENALPQEFRLQKAAAAGDFLCSSIKDNGQFSYEYNPLECKESEGYNWSEHWGAVLSLVRLYEATKQAKYLDTAEKAAGAAMDRLVTLTIDGQKFRVFSQPSKSKTDSGIIDTGECAMAATGLNRLNNARKSDEHKDIALALNEYLRHIQAANGALPVRYEFQRQKGQFSGLFSSRDMGQALTALAVTQGVYPQKENPESINRLLNYLASEWALADYNGHQEPFDYWGMIGFGAAYGFADDTILAKAHEESLDSLKSEQGNIQAQLEKKPLFDERRALEKRLVRCKSKLALMEKQGPMTRKNLIALVFGYCNNEMKGQILEPGRTEHGSFWNAQGISAATAVRLEGLEAVHDLLVNTPGTRYQGWIRRWEPRLDLVRAFMVQCQYSQKDTDEFGCPVSVAGAFRRGITTSRGKLVRLDYNWHGIFSLLGWNESGQGAPERGQ